MLSKIDIKQDISEQINEMKNIIYKEEKTNNIEEIIEQFYSSLKPKKSIPLESHHIELEKDKYPKIKIRFVKI